jgi:ferredoxin
VAKLPEAKMKILYLTGTGNCLYIAKRLGGELISIPQAVKSGNYNISAEKVGLVFPVYWTAVPLYVEEFLRKVKLKSEYIFGVMTYGFMDGGAGGHLIKIARESGINFAYINSIKMVDNYLPTFNMQKQIQNEPKKQIEQHLETIIGDIKRGKKQVPSDSLFDKILSGVMHKSGQDAIGPGIAQKYRVEDSCVKCGICALVCPLDNIQVQNAKPEFGIRCISCLACTQNCPQNSIRLKNERSKARYRNSHISLKEITESNS